MTIGLLKLANKYEFLIKNAGRKEDVLAAFPKLSKEIEKFCEQDPSGNLKYLLWQTKILDSGQALTQEIIDVTKLFDKYKENLPKKDINQYSVKEFTDLRDLLFKIKDKKTKKKSLYKIDEAPDTQTVYEDESCKLLLIKNKAASVHFGNGARWCISMNNASYFEDYDSSNVVFFFLLSKQLAKETSVNYKIAISNQRDVDNNIIEQIFWNSNDYQIDYMSLSSDYPNISKIKSIIDNLAPQQPKSILAKVTDNTATEKEIEKCYEFALRQKDENVKMKVIDIIMNNKNVPHHIIIDLCKNDDIDIRVNIASNQNSPKEALLILSKDEEKDVVACVAVNRNASKETLLDIYEKWYFNSTIISELVRNNNCTKEVLLKISKSKNKLGRSQLAEKYNCPKEILLILSKDEEFIVRYNVAKNRNCPKEALLILSKDKEFEVRSSVASNPNAPEEALLTLAKENALNIDYKIASNSNATEKVLRAIFNGINRSRVYCYNEFNPK